MTSHETQSKTQSKTSRPHAKSHSQSASHVKSGESAREDKFASSHGKSEHGKSDKESGKDLPNPIQAQKFLGGLDYPVTKDDLLQKAKQSGADSEVMEALENIPDMKYDSPIAVSREIGKQD